MKHFDASGVRRLTDQVLKKIAADGIMLDDVGGIIAATEVEGALQEIMTDLIRGDGIPGREMRICYLLIKNGTNPNTLKCKVGNRWNGDTIAETDNIVKNATTGNFTLDAVGKLLYIEAAGLTGNCIAAFGVMSLDGSGAVHTGSILAIGNDIRAIVRDGITGANLDLTVLVDTGNIQFEILYITDA